MTVIFDLDDTLYAEMEFVRSAYREIARKHGRELLGPMLAAPSPREAFDSTGLPIGELLPIYRNHFPDIRLPWQSLYTLASLKNRGHRLGIITDGRSLTQRNKIRALGLERFMEEELIFISEELGCDKISGRSFERVMELCGDGERYMYVGDNPMKDFVPGNRLGWETVCLINGAKGENLFSQDFSLVAKENRPKCCVDSLTQLLGFGSLKKL